VVDEAGGRCFTDPRNVERFLGREMLQRALELRRTPEAIRAAGERALLDEPGAAGRAASRHGESPTATRAGSR